MGVTTCKKNGVVRCFGLCHTVTQGYQVNREKVNSDLEIIRMYFDTRLKTSRIRLVRIIVQDGIFKCKNILKRGVDEEMEGSDGTCEDTTDTTMLVQIEEVKFVIRKLPFVTVLSPVRTVKESCLKLQGIHMWVSVE